MTEKIGGVEGTKLDVDFVDMERVSIYLYLFILHYYYYYYSILYLFILVYSRTQYIISY